MLDVEQIQIRVKFETGASNVIGVSQLWIAVVLVDWARVAKRSAVEFIIHINAPVGFAFEIGLA